MGFGWFKKIFAGNKGVVEEVSDVVDKWIPSATTKHSMSIEDLKAGDASQESARAMQLASHGTWFDSLVDGINRLVRPLFTVWAFGVLVGWWPAPKPDSFDPMTWNIIWTIVTFWFGSRMLFKDLPALIRKLK